MTEPMTWHETVLRQKEFLDEMERLLTKTSTRKPTMTEGNAIHEAMVFYWGERCPEHDAECPACQAWEQYDKAIATAPEGVLRMVEIKENNDD